MCLVAFFLGLVREEQCFTPAWGLPSTCSFGPNEFAASFGGYLFIAGLFLSLEGLVVVGGHHPDRGVQVASLATAIASAAVVLILLLVYAMVATL